jgi:hypothetical protein
MRKPGAQKALFQNFCLFLVYDVENYAIITITLPVTEICGFKRVLKNIDTKKFY